MIYTNNISEFSKKVENKLNDIICDNTGKYFEVTYEMDSTKENEAFFYIKTTWCMNTKDLKIIYALLDTTNLLFSAKDNYLTIWSKIKEGI